MRIVNDGVPEILFEFLKLDFYDKDAAAGTLSATTLLKPTQEIILTERYDDCIDIPASSRLWSVLGSGVHAALELMRHVRIEGQEERLFALIGGEKISGKPDAIMDGMTLHDFKVTSGWTLVYESRVPEWVKQLSIYRLLFLMCKKIELLPKAYIIAIIRDWSESMAQKNSDWPRIPLVQIPIELMGVEETMGMVRGRVAQIKACRALPDAKLPPCSDEERWWNAKKKQYIKCAKYCNVAQFCRQNKGEK